MTPTSVGPLAALVPAHPDWLFHHLRIEGPAETLAAFRAVASGAGIIPWHLDFEPVEEDAFLRIAAPQGQARKLSLEAARMLAGELRDAVARRHVGRIIRTRCDGCWSTGGTTEALRRVTLAPERDAAALTETVFRVSFWAADWTPWRALATATARFPGLRVDVQPRYDRG